MSLLGKFSGSLPMTYVVFGLVFLAVFGTTGYLFTRDDGLFQTSGQSESLAALSLLPVDKDVTQKIEYPVSQSFEVNIELDTNDVRVDGVEAIITYDPGVLSAELINFAANDFAQLKGTLLENIDKDSGGKQLGRIHIARTAAPLPPFSNQDEMPSYNPIEKNQVGTVASIRFKALKLIESSTISFDFSKDLRNDSNIAVYQGAGADGLGTATGMAFVVVPSGDSAHMYFEPSIATIPLGAKQQVKLLLDTQDLLIDGLDASFTYDKTELRVLEVKEAASFQQYSRKNINILEGRVDISADVKASSGSPGVKGSEIPVATLTVEGISPSRDAQMRFVYSGLGDSEDSNVSLYGQGVDVLGSVGDATYEVSSSVAPTGSVNSTLGVIFSLEVPGAAGSTKNRGVEVVIPAANFEYTGSFSQQDTKLNVPIRSDITGKFEVTITPVGYLPQSVEVTFTNGNGQETLVTPFVAGDVDGSGQVNALDYARLSEKFGKDAVEADFDASGVVNTLDYTYLLKNWRKESN